MHSVLYNGHIRTISHYCIDFIDFKNKHTHILFNSKKNHPEEDNSDCSSVQYTRKFW